MDTEDTTADVIEADVAKELALRLVLGLLFFGLAYLGVADALEATTHDVEVVRDEAL